MGLYKRYVTDIVLSFEEFNYVLQMFEPFKDLIEDYVLKKGWKFDYFGLGSQQDVIATFEDILYTHYGATEVDYKKKCIFLPENIDEVYINDIKQRGWIPL